uniref:Uncharacterized protein n=1 Tax=Romanomermis culicivorax TaxID=13658 RepID=A0A915IA48_ROMCU
MVDLDDYALHFILELNGVKQLTKISSAPNSVASGVVVDVDRREFSFTSPVTDVGPKPLAVDDDEESKTSVNQSDKRSPVLRLVKSCTNIMPSKFE